jgi:hypothetical protein
MMSSLEYDVGSAMGLAAWTEDATRSIVRGAALGEHGSDVAASADETLVANGLEAGEGSVEQMGADDEWEPPTGEEPLEEPAEEHALPTEDDLDAPTEFDPDSIRIRSTAGSAAEPEPDPDEADGEPYPGDPAGEALGAYEDGVYYEPDEDEYEHFEQPDAEQGGHHRDTPGSEAEEVSRIDADHERDYEEGTVRASTERDWLSEVSGGGGDDTLEWPAVRRRSSGEAAWRPEDSGEEPLDEPRVRHLFPVPDDTDWEIGELDYDRSKTRVT